MKKVLALLLCVGLLSNSVVSAISPRDLWRCRPSNKNPQPPCTEKQRSDSKKWLVGGFAAAIAAVLAALGIATTVSEVRKEQEKALGGEEVVVIQPAAPTASIEQKQAMLQQLRDRLAKVDALIAGYSPATDEQRVRLEQAKENRDAIAQQIAGLELEVARQSARQATGR